MISQCLSLKHVSNYLLFNFYNGVELVGRESASMGLSLSSFEKYKL